MERLTDALQIDQQIIDMRDDKSNDLHLYHAVTHILINLNTSYEFCCRILQG